MDQFEDRDQGYSESETSANIEGLVPIDTDVDGLPPVRLSVDELAAIQALPPTSALLILHRGPSAGARFLLDADKTSTGRSTASDIFLDDVTVSRRHAEFVRDHATFNVRDVGSLNGTYVNRERIESQILRAGDEVQIGKFRMTFYPSPAREAAG